MARTWVRVVVGIVALALGYTLASLWRDLYPDSDFTTIAAVGVITFIASFIALYFMTKGGGD